MKNEKFWKPIFIFAAAGGLLIFLAGSFRDPIAISYQPFQNIRVFLFLKISRGSSLFLKLKNFYRLAAENLNLEEENKKLFSQIALQADIQEENNFLRKALGLPYAKSFKFVDAGAFNAQFGPKGHIVLINKGSDEDINSGDAVITGSGILIGIITETFGNYSKAILASNIDFKVTAEIFDRDISGMARGALNEGMALDFISQNDEIKEGDLVVTKGNDMFPAGLLIGKVTKANSDNADLFKKVFIKAFAADSDLSRILIIKKPR